MTKLPSRIIALDIETDIPDPKGIVEDCQAFLLGVKEYRVEAGSLLPEEYHAFEAGQFAEGLEWVDNASGLIVGYNLFGFDYVVLRPWLEDNSIIEHTVDLFALLRALTKQLRGLKLHSVCSSLLGEGKLDLGTDAVAAWRDGKRDLVLRYNERDCDLAAKLWHFMTSAKSVRLGKAAFRLGPTQRGMLMAGGQFKGYKDWLEKEFETQTVRERIDPFVGIKANPLDLAREFDRFVCNSGGKIFYSRLIPADDYPSGEDTAPRSCPACGEYVFDSPLVFKGWAGGSDGSPSREGPLAASAELETLWAKISSVVAPDDWGPHFATTGFPRPEAHEARLHDLLGVSEDDFDAWVATIHSDELQEYIPRWQHKQNWFHRRSLRALEQYTLKMGLP